MSIQWNCQPEEISFTYKKNSGSTLILCGIVGGVPAERSEVLDP